MENRWKIIGSLIVAAFLSIFITQNVNALTLTKEVEPTGNQWIPSTVQCLFSGDSSWVSSNSGWCKNQPSNWDGDTYGIRTTETYPIKEGNYYQVYFTLRNSNRTPNIDINPIFWNFIESSDFTTVALEEFYVDVKQGATYCQTTYQSGTQTDYTGCTDNDKIYNKIYIFTLRAKNTGNLRVQVGTTSGVLISANTPGQTGPSYYNYTTGIRKIVELAPISNTEEAEQKTEEASNEGEQNSDQADSDNEQATSSLLDVAGSIIGAFSTTTGTCTFNADLGNVDFGNLNLCSGKPPEFASIIDTIFMLLLIPLIFMTVISLVHQFINLSKFAQGGD